MKRYQFSKQELKLLEGLQQAIAIYQFVDKRVVTLALSDGFCRLFGYEDRQQAYYDMDYDMYKDTHPDDVARIADAALRFATEDCGYDVVYRTRAGAEYRIVHATGEHVFTEDGVRLAHISYMDEGIFREGQSSVLNQSLNSMMREASLVKASRYDFLTGLPNMTYFFELADAAKESMMEAGETPVLLYMDLNGMKFFNTRHSFAEGDRLLTEFAKVLVHVFSNENCCHISADHFAAFTRKAGLEEKLRQLFEEAARINDGDTLPVRVGIYSTDMGMAPVSTACDRAKIACDSLRSTFRSGYSYYDRNLRDDLENRQYILTNLDRALEEKWIQVYYQPIVRAVNGRVCDEEALARWIDPARGFLSPAQFIPYLEDAGQIYKLDLYMLDRILEGLKIREEAGLGSVPQSINLSRSDFSACDMVEEVRRRVDAAGVSRSKITIELTESTIGSDFEFMKKQVERFRELGFSVWMDDFGSGYSSLSILQTIQFDLLKFDMSFMRKLDEGNNSKILLTELMRMTASLGVDTVCEGVETEAQVRFLQDIGCSKLQGYYFLKPIPLETILDRCRQGINIGFENPEESAYYEEIGQANLYDLSLRTSEADGALNNYYKTIPMCIIELENGKVRYARSSQSFREFMKRNFNYDLTELSDSFVSAPPGIGAQFVKSLRQCYDSPDPVFVDEEKPDGTVVHSVVKRISVNPVRGTIAVGVAILSFKDPDEGATYAQIARALAADYYNIYVVDLDTERFIEYTSPVGKDELAMERHGTDFFKSARRDTMTRIYEEDRETFLAWFTKENIVRELDEQGVFTATYRLSDTGAPMYVNMKIMRMEGGNKIILGVSIIDSQMKQREILDSIRREKKTLARIMALAEDYLSLYTIDPETGSYVEYTASDDYEKLGFAKEGEDFFRQGVIDGERTIYADDLPEFLEKFSREKILEEIRKNGIYKLQYHLVIEGKPRQVSLKIAPFMEEGEDKLFAGVRAWRDRQ